MELGLQQRIEYLSRAAVCAKSSTSHVLAPGDGEFLHELEDKMEVNKLRFVSTLLTYVVQFWCIRREILVDGMATKHPLLFGLCIFLVHVDAKSHQSLLLSFCNGI